MSTKHEIVLIDGGDDVSSSFASPESAPSRTTSAGGSTSSGPGTTGAAGGSKQKDKEPSGTEKIGSLAAAISKAFGGIGLFETVTKLKKAFDDVYKSVMNLDGKISEPSKPATQSSQPSGADTQPTARQVAQRAQPATESDQDSWNKGMAAHTSGSWNKGMDNLTASRKAPSGDDAWQKGLATISKNTAVNAEVIGGAGTAAAGAPQAAQGLTAVASAAGPLALAIGAVTVAAAAGAIAIKALFDTLSNEVKRLENVSADVNVATSMSEVRREMADMRRAEKIGPDLARFENVRSKLEDKTADLWTEVLKVLLKIFEAMEPAIEVVTDGIGVVAAGMEVANADLEIISEIMQGRVLDLGDEMKAKADAQIKLAKAVVNLMTKQQDEEADPEDPFMNAFLANFAGGGPL